MTFADLMSLLMCFFVLLLSFAEMDIIKFKQVAGSMKMAFGVQREVQAAESEQAQEFLQGRESPTPLFQQPKEAVAEREQEVNPESPEMDEIMQALKAAEAAAEQEAFDQRVLELTSSLQDEVNKGMVEVNTNAKDVVIRITEKASFTSGESKLRNSFIPTLKRLRAVLAGVDGQIIVAGHTDDRPIRTAKFRSNWDLSASRAASVVHELLQADLMPAERFIVEGHADAHPIAPNDTAENRAKNRRVELTVLWPELGDDPDRALSLPPAVEPN